MKFHYTNFYYIVIYVVQFQLQDLAMTMVELWTLMDTPEEEQLMFQNVTRNIAAAEHEITEPNSLCLEIINEVLSHYIPPSISYYFNLVHVTHAIYTYNVSCHQAEAEVFRLQEMKMSKIKEVLLKKRLVLEEICREAHMLVDGKFDADLSVESIESGTAISSKNKKRKKRRQNKLLIEHC